MNLIRAILALGLVVALQTALGRFWPQGGRFIDLHLLPPIWYGIMATQRQAMVVGAASGLLQDTWMQAGVFGLNGFKKTLLGWALGGLGTRFDLNGAPGRFVAGFAMSTLDGGLDAFLRNLLDRAAGLEPIWVWLVRAAVTGLLTVGTFTIVERVGRSRWLGRWF